MRALKWLAVGFAAGAAGAFVASLLWKRRLAQVTGYQAPAAAEGALAVGDPLVSAAPPTVN